MFLRCLINELGLKIWSLCFIPHFLCQAASNFRFYRRLGTQNNFPALIWSQGALFKITENRILPCVHYFFLFKNESVSSSVDSGLFFLNISIVVLSISRRLSTVLDIPRKCLTLSRNVCQISKIVQYNLTLNSTIRQKVSRCFTQFGVIFFFIFRDQLLPNQK